MVLFELRLQGRFNFSMTTWDTLVRGITAGTSASCANRAVNAVA
jgi:hypothetical protein